ncbi:zinc-binding protein A33-like isoform X2 [Stegostoma tigrinum]|uniref:zinc-binding protein A33-like isoform X2 n=1 Tax=Stegostoma tigrinum TaxID=3053191 RepID=UPI00202AF771|nr:zinc-binding protein A33-like isoform X2 [Stegostoma tigrinum]
MNMATGLAQEALGEELTCAICLEIYTDPVILDCKHSFCRSCIEETWNDTVAAPYCCPECRAEYTERPGLERNFKLANIVQKYLALEVSQDAVLCNYCTEKLRPAVKTCLKCEASMCPEHLRHHTESSVFKSHLLVDPTADISQWKCSEHQELLKIYCKEDKVCVCTLCTVFGKHKGHNCGSISEGEKELRNHLQHQLQKIRNNVEAVQLALSDLHKEKKNAQGLNSMADRMKDASEPFIAQVPSSDIDVSVAERLLEWVQQQYVTTPQPVLDRNFLVSMYGQTPTLDPYTAFPHLILSDSNRSVSGSKRQQPYSDNPKRFNYWWQVLCTERLSYGRCYWEVEIGGDRRRWDVGMCYESLSRKGKGKECSLGQNKESWCLYSEPGSVAALHDNNATKLTAQMPTRVGVYVDFEAGIISFYSVSDRKLTLLHNFREQTFTKPLYPALGVADFTTSLALCSLK